MVYRVLSFRSKCQQLFYHWHICSCEKNETKRPLMFGAGNESGWQKKLCVYTGNSVVASPYNPVDIRGEKRDKKNFASMNFCSDLASFRNADTKPNWSHKISKIEHLLIHIVSQSTFKCNYWVKTTTLCRERMMFMHKWTSSNKKHCSVLPLTTPSSKFVFK